MGRLLRKKKKTLAVAESCTGGLLQHRLTQIPGSSGYFRGGVVAYSDDLKRSLLGVSEKLLKNHGAVSAPVARQMAKGIRRLAGSDIGLAITGIAGPTGGTKAKPVGLVYIAFSDRKQAFTRRHFFTGDRSMVKFKATQAALGLVRRYLSSRHSEAPSLRSGQAPGRRILKTRSFVPHASLCEAKRGGLRMTS